jgi:uncharacterized protein YecT (DUF1311 family)
VLVTAVLALLLIGYVFAGGRKATNNDRPHCSSRQIMDIVKRELFDRAGTLRGGSDDRLSKIATYSVLLPESRLVRRLRSGSTNVECSGQLVLDLPPGVATADGRRSLTADLGYVLASGPEGMVRLASLANTDAIVSLLSTASEIAPQPAPALPAPQPAPANPAPVPPERAEVQTTPPPPSVARSSPQRPRGTARPIEPQAPAPAKPAARPTESRPPTETPRPKPMSAPAAVLIPHPSFDCRSAHTRGERAVCSDPDLARLDREMAAQFHRAVSAARPGQRQMLKRTGRRFIHYRDSCGSAACMADAYRGRMREIDDIMTGPW